MGKQLTHKPLIEALVQLKWTLKEIQPGIFQDPAYPLYVGLFYERINDTFKYMEKLPSTQVPDNITPHVVKYRFRKSEGGWPLVQTGPGIATLNLTEEYDWDLFLSAARSFFSDLLKAYSLNGQSEKPKFTSVLLRYFFSLSHDILESQIDLDKDFIDALNELAAIDGKDFPSR